MIFIVLDKPYECIFYPPNTHIHTQAHTYIYTYIYVSMYVCVCVCVCVCENIHSYSLSNRINNFWHTCVYVFKSLTKTFLFHCIYTNIHS